MAFSFWKKMFADSGNESAPVDEKPAEQGISAEDAGIDDELNVTPEDMSEGGIDAVEPVDAAAEISKLEVFVEYVAKELVDNPDAVTVSTDHKDHLDVIQIRCEKRDIGKLIGKSGKTISALRLLVSSAGGRYGLRVTVDVLD